MLPICDASSNLLRQSTLFWRALTWKFTNMPVFQLPMRSISHSSQIESEMYPEGTSLAGNLRTSPEAMWLNVLSIITVTLPQKLI